MRQAAGPASRRITDALDRLAVLPQHF